ncbi:protein DEFECTIVE IN MERISTEM SILENCING 3-like isoform X2 [Cornus florida]|uniref:protein DEFECTIVE IN MERISTEM SILENCING 3-like isoform X2 n=1 Tax=Cornus florida TaxID=4283 RepID=UPI00289B9820|nr:protein DEFECTIVE IN MERISTEM SILENCING 3-like isoform X2 [Cornus florida]
MEEDDQKWRCTRTGTPNWRCKERVLSGYAVCEKHHFMQKRNQQKKRSNEVSAGESGVAGRKRKNRKSECDRNFLSVTEMEVLGGGVQGRFGEAAGTSGGSVLDGEGIPVSSGGNCSLVPDGHGGQDRLCEKHHFMQKLHQLKKRKKEVTAGKSGLAGRKRKDRKSECDQNLLTLTEIEVLGGGIEGRFGEAAGTNGGSVLDGEEIPVSSSGNCETAGKDAGKDDGMALGGEENPARFSKVNNAILLELSIHTKALAIQDSTASVPVDQNDSCVIARDGTQNGARCEVDESAVCNSKKFQDELKKLGLKIKWHEDNIKSLKTQKTSLDDSILDRQVSLGKYHSSSVPWTENEDISHIKSEEETVEHIIRQEKSAAGILFQLKTHHGAQAYKFPLTKDVLGIVASLGKVDDDNLSRLLSEYLGMEIMLAVVCKTYEGVKALETYDNEGSINESSGLHGLGASIGRPLDGRFRVICLETLTPYVGKFVADDPQRRLDLLKPRLPSGESPPGFVGFAVNLINVDTMNLFCLTTNGHGLRETLLYFLLSCLQVYRTRADMLQALPFICDGALSLDGGMIKNGVFCLGRRREDVDVKFPKSSGMSNKPVDYFDTKNQIKEMKWELERLLEDIQRQQALLDHAKFNFRIKKQEFVKFLAESSRYATQN